MDTLFFRLSKLACFSSRHSTSFCCCWSSFDCCYFSLGPNRSHRNVVTIPEQGTDTSRIMFERMAGNTCKNAALSFEAVEPRLDKPWILITSAFHLPRSIGIFCKAGRPMIPYPVDHQSKPVLQFGIGYSLGGHKNELDLAIHEWLGLTACWLTGKTTALFPDQCTP